MNSTLDNILYYTFWFLIHLDIIAVVIMTVGTIALFLKRTCFGKRLLIIGLIPFLIINFTPLGPTAIMHLENMLPRPATLPENIDGLILLGGCYALRETAERGEPVYNKAGTRIFQFLDLARHYPKAKILFTGNPLEAKWSEKALIDHGIEKERLVIEGSSSVTLDHPALLKKLVDPTKRYLLVTSAFHMPKAFSHFKREGFTNLIPYPVDYHTSGTFSLTFWYASILQRVAPMAYKQACAEWAGLVRSYIAGGGESLIPQVES